VDKPAKKLLRCAIYTRKSTEHNLDLEFNSLDAQREACEAYIKSQAHEGWRLARGRYDDGAFSGASLDRPALRELLIEVGAGKIDIIVVYKVDRLTRSLADFAKLVELFDQHSVSFVSVTQSFNTTNSMGRLTLNVLLSFAQFEREVIGERVRDKIAASKAKGIWVGGSVPLGYRSVDKKLVVVPEEAETVRLIFRRYLEVGSIRALMEDLDRNGIRTRQRAQQDGSVRGGIRFGVGPLAYLLRNRFVIGEVVYRGAIHRGEHEAIVDRALFDAVREKLAASATARELRLKASPALLAGRFFDDRSNRMTPTHTNKRGARYRYYVSHAIMQKRLQEAGSVTRVPAPEIESTVVNAMREHFQVDPNGENHEAPTERNLIERYATKIVMQSEAIEIHVAQRGEDENSTGGRRTQRRQDRQQEPTIIIVPWSTPAGPAVKGVLHSPTSKNEGASARSESLLLAIAKSRTWVEDLSEGRVASFAEIANREGRVERHVRLLASLAFVSPRMISAMLDGRKPPDATITGFAKHLSYSWVEQVNFGPSGS
jgi:site-specific DNA recombinase